MSYSLRNTILLAITLLLIVLGGGLWIYYNEYSVVTERKIEIQKQEAQLVNLEREVDRFQAAFNLNEQMHHRINNYPKAFLPNSSLSHLYNYVRLADPGSTFMNFAFTDSTQQSDHGRIRFSIDGATDYRDLRDFMSTVERAVPMVKFTELQIRPSNNNENLNEVVFRINAEAYYDRSARNVPRVYASVQRSSDRFNPFFPLIHDVKANENNQIDVERSRLTAMGDTFIFLIDQNGQLQRLGLRERVYLGYLESISADNQTATFFLNKGGLVERKTLRIIQ
jgi:Tfp pilus assembly protein PilO